MSRRPQAPSTPPPAVPPAPHRDAWDILPVEVDALATFLRNFPADGKIRHDDQQISYVAIGSGMIEYQLVTKPCATCGTARPDYGYHRLTTAGRYFLAALEPR